MDLKLVRMHAIEVHGAVLASLPALLILCCALHVTASCARFRVYVFVVLY